MRKSKDREKTFWYFPTRAKNDTARHWLTLKDHFVHEVGKLKVISFGNDDVVVVNEESLKIHFFESEREAMDFCLDVYPETKEMKQGELF